MEYQEIDIVNGCKRGERKAQEQLYRNYFKALMQLCMRYTQNENDATDVLNRGFLKVFLNINKYDPAKANLYTWMRTIIINTCIDFIKQSTKRETHKELKDASEEEIDAAAIERMDADHLLFLIRELTPATQAVFNLYVMEGYNHKEIGSMLSISEGTSKWHLSEARKQLKQMILSEEVKI